MSNLTTITIDKMQEVNAGPTIKGQIAVIDNVRLHELPYQAQLADCHLLWLCEAGSSKYTCDTKDYVTSPNDFSIISRGQIIEGFQTSPDYRGVGMVITQEFFTEIIRNVHELATIFMFARNNPVSHLLDTEADTFRTYLEKIKEKISETNHMFRTAVVQSLFTTMVYDLGNAIFRIEKQQEMSSGHTRAEAIFFNFIQLLTDNYRSERHVGWYSREMSISPKYLFEMVKEVSGRTPNEWIDMYVVKEMRLMLKNSNLSVKEIANELHFNNQSFMAKYFKLHVGLTPTEYRKQ
ncbi:MAG: helix-turn-helix domain-containing protein [Prevotella sp.]|jgi:AraC-like DNA-binding protein